jgi:hypothetical protein
MKINLKLNSLALTASFLILFFILFSSTALAVSPVVTAIAPPSGPNTGGNQVVIEGSGFAGATEVDFGTVVVPPSNFTVLDDGVITVYAPPKTDKTTVNIKGSSPVGTSDTSAVDKYTYTSPIVGSNISPSNGPNTGGNKVIIAGSGFTGATEVDFGTVVVFPSNFTVLGDRVIIAHAPPGTAGTTVNIKVTSPIGTSVPSEGNEYTYVAVTQQVTKISPCHCKMHHHHKLTKAVKAMKAFVNS